MMVARNNDMPRQSESEVSAIAAAALNYCAAGWSVVPLRPRDKRPLIEWERFQHELASSATVTYWYRRWPDANVGVVTGAISNLVVLDIDPNHGGDASIGRLERKLAPLPVTVQATTGGGGRHLYFAHPGGLVRNRTALAQGIDVRGDGGYIVAPPSVHPSGRRYAWVPGRSPAEIVPAVLPRWILVRAGGSHVGRSRDEWRRLVRKGVPEGQRNSTIASLTGHLLWHGVDAEIALELLLAWNRLRCRPPLDDAEVAQVVTNIVQLHEHESTGPSVAD